MRFYGSGCILRRYEETVSMWKKHQIVCLILALLITLTQLYLSCALPNDVSTLLSTCQVVSHCNFVLLNLISEEYCLSECSCWFFPEVSDFLQILMYCPFCGATLESCPAFCSACGKNIKFLKDKVPDGNEPSTSAGT